MIWMNKMRISINILVYLATFREVYGERIRYISTEHPVISWYNSKYARYVNLTAQRYARNDPFYYVGFHVDVIWPVINNVNIDFYVYEYLSNQYKRSFVELHFEACDMISKNIFFGISFGQFFPHPCPLQPGVYHIENITVPLKNVPENVPFTKGRIIGNFTSRDTKELLGSGYLDIEVKEINTKRMKKRNKRSLSWY